jgi:hypothetical protein
MEEKEKERWENWTGEEMQEQTAIVYGECKEKIDQLVEEYGEDLVVHIVNSLL